MPINDVNTKKPIFWQKWLISVHRDRKWPGINSNTILIYFCFHTDVDYKSRDSLSVKIFLYACILVFVKLLCTVKRMCWLCPSDVSCNNISCISEREASSRMTYRNLSRVNIIIFNSVDQHKLSAHHLL